MRVWVRTLAANLLLGALVGLPAPTARAERPVSGAVESALGSSALGESPAAPSARVPVVPELGAVRAPADESGSKLADAPVGCVGWFARARALHDDQRLLDAREAASHCDAPSCSKETRQQCSGLLRELALRIPRLIVRVKTLEGGHIDHARAFVDGLPVLPDTLIELDPGEHVIRTQHDDYVGRMSQVHLASGERRTLVIQLRARIALSDERFEQNRFSNWTKPEAAWALLGASVGAFASALMMDAYTAERVENLKRCTPNCDERLVASVERDIQLTKLAAGLGVLSLATAAWIALADQVPETGPRASYMPQLRVTGGPSRAQATLVGRFDEAFALRLAAPRVAAERGSTKEAPPEFHPRKAPTPAVPRALEAPTCRKGCTEPPPESLDVRRTPR